jgi:sensor histidine kinase YesM
MAKIPTGPALLNALSGRLARNIYFWIILIWTRSDYSYSRPEIVFSGLQFLVLAALFYTNNLLLIPRLLALKRYKAYLAAYSALCITCSFCYVFIYKAMRHYFPGTAIWKVSPILSGKETPAWSFTSLLREQPFYFIALLIAGAIFAMSWYVMDHQRQQKRMEAARKEHLETELNFLKIQINPHFLFNTMNNLYTLTFKKSDEAPKVVAKLSNILRYLLYESNTSLVRFEKEQEIMLAYFDLEKLRLSGQGNMNIKITSDRDYEIPPLLWTPILENVFKHGTSFIGEGFSIDYSFIIQDYVLTICSGNKFLPREHAGQEMHQGIGLVNLKKRLELLFPGNFTMEQKSEHHYFTTRICIQLKR